MPIFEVTNPQGKKYRVNAPEGATQDDAIRYIATQQQPQQTGMFGQPTDQPRILQDGEGSDFTRGLFTYTDQYGGILGGAQALAGKAIDSDEQIMKGLERMEESEAAVGRRGVKKTDSFTGALEEGVGAVLTEYIPFIAGQGVGMIGEAFLTATAGAMVGSAAAPGAGTATGALTGLVAKNLVKKGIMESAKQLGREEGKELIKNKTEEFIKSEAGRKAIKDIYKQAGSNTALGLMAGKFGAGELTGRAIDEAIVGIDDPAEQLEKIKELSTGKLATLSAAHALANYIGLKIGLGSLEKLSGPSQSMLLNIAKNVGVTGLKEGYVEAIQTALEREGAELPLGDKAAIEEYINAAAAGFFMPIIPATIGGVRTSLSEPPTPDTPTPDVSLPEDTPPGFTPAPETEADRKGFKLDKNEEKRRKDEIKAQERINLDEDTVAVDLDDADARPKLIEDKTETQEFELPELKNVEQSLQEKANVSGPREFVSDSDRSSVPVSEPNVNKPGPNIPPSDTTVQANRDSVVSSTDTTSPATGREGLPQPTLEEPTVTQPQQEPPARGMERIQVGFENGQPIFEDRPKRVVTKEDLEPKQYEMFPPTKRQLGQIKSQAIKKQAEDFLTILNYGPKDKPENIKPERLKEAADIYKSILNTDGKAAADKYLKNKKMRLKNEIVSDTSDTTLPLFASNNEEKAQAFAARDKETYVDTEELYDGRPIAYTVYNKTKLTNLRPGTVASFLVRDKAKKLNLISNPLLFSNTPTVDQVKSILEQKLDTTQYNQLLKTPAVFTTIANQFKIKTKDQAKGSTSSQEKSRREQMEADFDERAPSIPGFRPSINIPSFLKTGAVFGNESIPITGALTFDKAISNALNDYVFEEAADTSPASLFGGPRQNLDKADKARRKAFRDEFINSPIVKDYMNRTGINIEAINKDVATTIEQFEKGNVNIENQAPGDIRDEISKAQAAALKKQVRDNVDKKKLAKDKKKLEAEVRKKIRASSNNALTDKIDMTDVEVNENADKLLEFIEGFDGKDPIDNMIDEATNEKDLVNNLIDLFDDRPYVSRLIAKYKDDTPGLLNDLRNIVSKQSKILYDRGDVAQAAYKAQQVALIDAILKVPNLDMVSVRSANPEQILQYKKDIIRENKSDEKAEPALGFYLRESKVNIQDSKNNVVVIDNTLPADAQLRVLLHEMSHVGTVDMLVKDMLTRLEVDSLVRIMEKAESIAKQRGLKFYGFKNEREFIAEAFSNPNFQRFLASISSKGLYPRGALPQETGIVKNLFDAFVLFVSKALGLRNIDNTVLKDTIQLSNRMFNAGVKPPTSNIERARAWKRKENFKEVQDELNSIADEEAMGVAPERLNYRKLATKIMYPESEIDAMAYLDGSGTPNNIDRIKIPKKETKADRTVADIDKDNTKLYEREKNTFGKRVVNGFREFFKNSDKGLTDAIRKFTNRSIDIKKVQDNLDRSGLILKGVDGFNNVYDQLTLAFGISSNYMKGLQPIMENYSKALYDYLQLQKTNGLNEEEAKGRIKTMLTGLHELERREIKYILDVPLSNEKIIRLANGKLTSPAQLRNDIMKQITTKKWDISTEAGRAKRDADLKKYKATLQRLANPDYQVSGKNTLDARDGSSYFSPEKKGGETDINSKRYDVSDMTVEQASIARAKYENLRFTDKPMYDAITRVRESMSQLNEDTKALNQLANYASPQAMNIIDFYGWKNYIPLKRDKTGIDDSRDAFYNPTGGRMSRELKQLESSFEGNAGESSDPLAQTLVDASRAASRAGRIGYTQSIYNAVTQSIEYRDPISGEKKQGKAIPGKLVKIFSYEQRYRNDPELQKLLGDKDTIVHFLDDGSLAVLKINDENLVQAIRGAYSENPQWVSYLNAVTGGLGQLHTRFNPPFATLNFVRDAITNIFYISADLGLKDTGGYLQSIASQITNGGMIDTAKVMKFYIRGDLKSLDAFAKKQLAKGKPQAAHLREYLDTGGMISYRQGLSVETAYQRLQDQVRRSTAGRARTRQNIKDYFDIWMSTFEMATRAAAYGVAKSNYLSKNAPGIDPSKVSQQVETAARQSAATYAKRLSNFEERGISGDALGAWFMFFKPSSVGIVRAFETLSASLQRKEVAQSNLPDYIKGNPEALKNWSDNFDQRRKMANGMAVTGIGVGFAVWHMSALLAGDDEDNKTRQDDPARWTRYARLDLSMLPGFKEGDVLQIPWGFGPGGFAAIGAQLAAFGGADRMDMMDMVGNTINIALDSFMPLPFSRMNPIDNPLKWLLDTASPSAVRPVFEYAMNTNAFGQNIYNPFYSKYGSAYGGSDNMPQLYKDFSIFLAEATNGAIDWSPSTIAFFSNNYADAVGRFAHDLYGIQLTIRGQKDFDFKRDTILFDSFISKYSDIEQRMYTDAVKEVEDMNRRIKLFEQTNPIKYNEVLQEFPAVLSVIDLYNTMRSELNKLNQRANQIRKMPGLNAKERAAMLKPIKELQLMHKRSIANMVEQGLQSRD